MREKEKYYTGAGMCKECAEKMDAWIVGGVE